MVFGLQLQNLWWKELLSPTDFGQVSPKRLWRKNLKKYSFQTSAKPRAFPTTGFSKATIGFFGSQSIKREVLEKPVDSTPHGMLNSKVYVEF